MSDFHGLKIDYTNNFLVGQLNTLLTAYGLPRDGTVEAKRKSFRQFIGILSDV